MAEQNEIDKYIKCSKCRCKYINDDDHIKNDFGFNRLNERFKTCMKCRERGREQNKAYREAHKDEIAERKQEYNKQYFQEHKEYYSKKHKEYRDRQLNKEVDEHHKCCTRCYKIQPLTEYGEYETMLKIDGKYQEATIQCKSCNTCRKRDKLKYT